MRRLLGAIGICFFIALILTNSLGFNFAIAFGALSFAVTVILLFCPFGISRKLSMFSFMAFGACAIYCLSIMLFVQPALILDGEKAVISAAVTDVEEQESGSYYGYTIKTDSIDFNGAPQELKLNLYSETPLGCTVGDRIDGSVYFVSLENSGAKYFAKNIYLKCYASSISVSENTDNGFSFTTFATKLRLKVAEYVGLNISKDEGSVILGVSFGSGYLTDELSNVFRFCGVSHIFAVSGLHISIMSQILLMLFVSLGIRRRCACVITVSTVWFFVFIVGFPFSAIRSAIMFTIYAAGLFIYRDSDALNSLGFSLLAITLFSPFAALDVGLLSSASSCIGIILFSKPVYNWLCEHSLKAAQKSKMLDYVLKSLATTFSVIVLLLPCVVLYYNNFSLIAPISNLLLIPLSFVLLFCTVIGVIILTIPVLNLFAPVFFFVAAIFAKIMIIFARLLSKIPYANINVGYTYIAVWVGCCILMAAVTVLIMYKAENRRRIIRFYAVLCTIALVFGICSNAVFYRDVTEVIVVDVGQGETVLVCGNGKAVQIGCVGDSVSYRVSTLLTARGINSLETLLITDDDTSQEKQASALSKRVTIDSILIPDSVGKIRFDFFKNCSYISDDVVSINPWSGCEIEYLCLKNIVKITIGKTRYAIALSGSNVSKLDGTFNAVISTSNTPSGVSEFNCDLYVVSADESHSAAAVSKLAAYGVTTYATQNSGSLVLKTRGKGDLSAGRLKDA